MLKACLLAAAVCMDTFFAAMGCRMSGIHIPKRCAALISLVGTVFLGVSLLGGALLADRLPVGLCRYGGAVLLAIIGLIQLLKECLTAILRNRRQPIRRRALGLVFDICLDETAADTDGSKVLGLAETPAFAAAMSLDSLASGVGAGLQGVSIPVCLILTLVLGFVLTVCGNRAGKLNKQYSWLGGVMLLVLAVYRAMSRR